MKLRKLYRFIFAFFLLVILSFIVVSILVNTSAFQTWIIQKVTDQVSENTDATISVSEVDIRFLKTLQFQNVCLKDKNNDTIIFAGAVDADISAWSFFGRSLSINKLKLTNTDVKLVRYGPYRGMNLNFGSGNNNDDGEILLREKEKKGMPNLDINRVILDSVNFAYYDSNGFTYIDVFVPSGLIKMEELDLEKMHIKVASTVMANPEVHLLLDKNPNKIEKEKENKGTHFLKNGMEVHYKDVQMIDGHFTMKNIGSRKFKSGSDGLNFAHLDVENINMSVSWGNIIADTILNQIEHMSARDHCGIEIASMTGFSRVATNEITVSQLNLVSPNSVIKDSVSLVYNDFDDFKDFERKVKMGGQFRDSKISFKDINYFAGGSLQLVEATALCINADVSGNLANLKAKNMDASIGEYTKLKGDAKLSGLPDIWETYINVDIDNFETRYSDLPLIYENFEYPKELEKLGLINFKGHFDGFISDFVTTGTMVSELGNTTADLHLKLNRNEDIPPEYNGLIALDSFHLGRLLGLDSLLGHVSMNSKVIGQGFNLEEVAADIAGKIDLLQLKGYDYRDIELDGRFDKKLFNGTAQVSDDNIDFRFDGLVDLNDSLPEFKFFSNMERLDLQALNLIGDPIALSSFARIDMKGNNPDNLVGEATFINTTFTKEGQDYLIDTIILNAHPTESGTRRIDINSDEITGFLEGQFKLLNIPNVVMEYVTEETDFAITDSIADTSGHFFAFDFKINDKAKLARLIHPELVVPGDIDITGYFDNIRDTSGIDIFINKVRFDNFEFRRIHLTENDVNGHIDLNTNVGKVYVNDSLMLDNTQIDFDLYPDVSNFSLNTNEIFLTNYAAIQGKFMIVEDSFKLQFDDSDISLNNKVWSFADNNSALITDKNIFFDQFRLVHDNESIGFNAINKDSIIDVVLNLNKIKLEDFSNLLLLNKITISGFADGYIRFNDVFGNNIINANLDVIDLAMNDIPLGFLHVYSKLQSDGYVNIDGSLVGENNEFDFYGYYPLNSDDGKEISIDIDIDKVDLQPGMIFLENLVDELKGSAKGNLVLSGPPKKPNLLGRVVVNDLETKIGYLQTEYNIKREVVQFKSYGIEFDSVEVSDNLQNIAYLNGTIWHKNLKDWRLDLYTNTPQFLYLNTKKSDNESFYGKVIAEGPVLFKGPFNAIEIFAYFTDFKKGTKITIPLAEENQAENYGFYSFVDPIRDTIIINQGKRIKENNLSVVLDLEMTPNAEIDFIFDPATNEKLEVFGNGNVKLVSNANTELDVYGLYEILEGIYFFKLQNVVDKKFILKKGGSISFSGDIYEAILNVDAIYSRTKTSTYDLISEYLVNATQDEINRSKNQYSVELSLGLRGEMQQPNINFGIRVIDPDPLIKTYIDNKLQNISLNQNELNRQTFGLLVLNRFLPSLNNSANNSSNPIITGNISTLTEFISNQLSLYLTDWLSSFVTDLDFNINYRLYDSRSELDPLNPDPINNPNIDRQEINIALVKRFFNDRLKINVGGNIDFGTNADPTQTANNNTNFSQDFKVEYALTDDGRIVIKAFSRGDYDIFEQNNINRTGIGITYTEDFNDFKDLRDNFTQRRQRRKANRDARKQKGRKEDGPVLNEN